MTGARSAKAGRSRPQRSRLAVSVGCPCGVGPEVAVVGAAAERAARVLLVGDLGAVRVAAKGRGIEGARVVSVSRPEEAWDLPRGKIAVWQPTERLAAADRKPGAPTKASGAAQLAWIHHACDLVARGAADALVTGPVSKEAVVRSGAPGSHEFLGHTEHLQRRLGSPEVIMAFRSRKLATSLVTTHLPLAEVPPAISPDKVASATYWLAWLLARTRRGPVRVAVASLNPHAGEGGLLGPEERSRIVPGIEEARGRLAAAKIAATLDGPVPAETAFRLMNGGRWGGVVAMYHDQATIPMKLAAFGDTVNVSLGLPIVRTSVDHGTGYDRAGKWTADAEGMVSALALGAVLAEGRPAVRAVVQRVRSARVEVGGEVVGAIAQGLLLYVGLGRGDGVEDWTWLLGKIAGLRLFEDEAGKMGRSVSDVGGALLLVSQFTLYGDVRRGRRPSFDDAMPPEEAERAYGAVVEHARTLGVPVETGRFRADMQVHSVNDGPVTLWLDSVDRSARRSG